jgi:hypothetical protein
MMMNTIDALPMRFQNRDERLLQTIQDYGGVLAKRQVQAIFWPLKSSRVMHKRLSKLKDNGYIAWPSLEQRKHYPIPEPIIWLDWKGVLLLANLTDVSIPAPTTVNENQLRTLETALRAQGWRWLREPHWTQLKHDLSLVDMRLKIEKDIQTFSHLRLVDWQNEGVFRADMDRVSFSYMDKNGRQRSFTRGVIPDGYFCLLDLNRHAQGLPARAHFLLELDMATHAHSNFSLEKVAAGTAYINSQPYKQRFGSNAGRWLIVTTGQRRLEHLMTHTHEKIGKNSSLFLFTTLASFLSVNVFSEALWSVCGQTQKQKLLSQEEV